MFGGALVSSLMARLTTGVFRSGVALRRNLFGKTHTRSGVVIALAVAFWVAAPLAARADTFSPCQAGLVSSIRPPTPTLSACTIGNLTFVWSGFSGISPDDVTFTPDASNPFRPGFTLSTVPGVSFSLSGTQSLLNDLSFGLCMPNSNTHTCDPFPGITITGATVTESGAAASSSPSGAAQVEAILDLSLVPRCALGVAAGIIVTNGQTVFDASSDTVSNQDCGGEADGDAQILLAVADGSASITSASFYINEAPASQVPEPGSMILLASGLITGALWRAHFPFSRQLTQYRVEMASGERYWAQRDELNIR